jgi:ABC-2 type transport system permease protein
MYRNIKSALLFTYIETVSYIRVKEAFFFAFVFPIFIFILFGNIWGGDASYDYAKFLLSGVIGMTITSDSIFSIGPVIRVYRTNNVLKFLRNLPISILFHFFGFFLSRILIMTFAILILCISSVLFFNTNLLAQDFITFVVGIFMGSLVFAFLSLNVSFFSKAEMGRGILSFIFFIMLFLSGAFYPINMLPEALQPIAKVLPLTHLIHFLRGDYSYLWILMGWIVALGALFSLLFNRVSIKR